MNKKKKIVLFDIDYTILDTDALKKSNLVTFALYNEVLETFGKLKEVADFGIFSEGDIAFQKKKIKETNIENYFMSEHIHIFEKKNDMIKKILDRYENSGDLFLVDDKLSVLHLAKQYDPAVFTIWVKRGFYAMKQEPIEGFTPDGTVETLHDIVPLIAKE
jgi:phosphoglycolate phosphatase-like HAD superfamily hydrolase